MANSNYDKIASEYYDDKHVTSRNFDDATRYAIKQLKARLNPGKILELGAGRGRVKEFFQADLSEVVQIDNSTEMFRLQVREEPFLKVLADACQIPLESAQFENVVGFLVDPFFGLDSMSEAFRMLKHGGKLFLTVPTYEWAFSLRKGIGIEVMTTRFKVLREMDMRVVLPSLVHPKDRIREIVEHSGFQEIFITDHPVPRSTEVLSLDITGPAQRKGEDPYSLNVIHVIQAVK